MAETSSAAFCAAKNWDASQTTTNSTPSSSSTLTDLLNEFKTTTTSNKSQLNKTIKNENGVKDQLLLDKDQLDNYDLKNSSSNMINLNPINSTLIEKLNSDLLTSNQQQQNSNFSTIKENNISNNSMNKPPSMRPDNEQLNKKTDNQNESKGLIRNDKIKFKTGFKLEACDSTGTWYPAKVVDIKEQENQVLIHFIRWSKKFDVWMSMDSTQLRELTKDDNDNSDYDQEKNFTIGKLVLASWSDNKKYPGVIKTITSDGNYNIAFLDGYRKKVKKSLVEHIPEDYQFNFNSPTGKF